MFIDPARNITYFILAMKDKHILIMGAGAIGSVFGGLLAKRGHEVVLVGRKVHMDAVAKKGLCITGLLGNHRIKNLVCFTDIAAVKKKIKTPFDFILVTVKTYDTEHAAKEIAPLVKKHTRVISLQNGLTNIDALKKKVSLKKIIAGRVIFGVELTKSGHVTVTVWAQDVAIGKTEEPRVDSKVKQLAGMFTEAGIPAQSTRAIEQVIWTKVLYNGALNPLGAFLNMTYGELAKCPETREYMNRIIEETYAVLKKRKIKLPWKNAEGYLAHFYNNLIPPTAAHYPSMRRDLKEKKSTEIDALNGAVVKYGDAKGMRLPFNEVLVHLVKHKEC